MEEILEQDDPDYDPNEPEEEEVDNPDNVALVSEK